jgi:hypothetical protein
VWVSRVEKWIPPCGHGHGGEWEHDDDFTSCGGYIGDWDDCGIVEDAKSEVEATVANRLHGRKWWVKLWRRMRPWAEPIRQAFCRHRWGEFRNCVSREGIDSRSWCTKGCGAYQVRALTKEEVKAA